MSVSNIFDITKYPEIPAEKNEFDNALSKYSTDISQKGSIMQPPIDRLNTKVSELKNIQTSYKNFIEKYNKQNIESNQEKSDTNSKLLSEAKNQLEIQKMNLNNMVNRENAADNNVGFFMFKPLGSTTYRVLQILTLLFGVVSIYIVIKMVFGTTYINPIDAKVKQTIAQTVGLTPQTTQIGGSIKKLLKLFRE
jgi:hypothetical protein